MGGGGETADISGRENILLLTLLPFRVKSGTFVSSLYGDKVVWLKYTSHDVLVFLLV